MTRIGVLLVPEKSVMLAVVIPLSIAISYQGVFSILRVRPEISWLTMSAVCCWCLAELKRHDTRAMRAALLFALALLPMNHMLSWFACLFVAGYIGLFARTRVGWKMCLACFAALATGVVINSAVRSWIVTGDISLFPKLNSPGAGTGQSLKEFLWNVFWNSPSFLNDTALGKNWWNRILPGSISQSASHCLVATLLWAAALPLPLLMRSWESRYAAAVPLLTLVLFYGSGYFNPTYTPLLVVYALLISIYVSASSSFVRPVRFGAAAIVVISFINGGSFLSTRVLNHGRATFFSVESDIRGEVSRLPAGCTIAVAERFQSVVRPGIDKKVILFKDKLPADVDLVILDNYDYDMYRFVPDYEQRRAEIDAVRAQFTEVFAYDRPVYNRDAIRPEALGCGNSGHAGIMVLSELGQVSSLRLRQSTDCGTYRRPLHDRSRS
ncbi:MAG: hypothetical protein U0892_06130 [Pirellulales bacterium]